MWLGKAVKLAAAGGRFGNFSIWVARNDDNGKCNIRFIECSKRENTRFKNE